MSDLITDAIVEAGLKSLDVPEWVDMTMEDDVRAILEAAAPLIAAKALQDAAKELHLGVGISALRITGEHAEEIARLALLAIADRIERGKS